MVIMNQQQRPARLAALLETLKPNRKTRIIDVGANPVHEPPYQFLLDQGACELWGFEPDQRAFENLQDRQGIKGQHYLPYAIGDGDEKTLYICRESGFTSLFRPSDAFQTYVNHFRHAMTVVGEVTLPTRRLDDIDELPECDLLKIDIQGSEAMVFEHGPKVMSKLVAVITEVAFIALYDGQPLLDEQMRLLRGYDLHLGKFIATKQIHLRGKLQSGLGRPKGFQNQLVDGDAVFVRQVTPESTMESERLKHLAILSDSVLASPDLVLRCLDVLQSRGETDAAATQRYVALLAGPEAG